MRVSPQRKPLPILIDNEMKYPREKKIQINIIVIISLVILSSSFTFLILYIIHTKMVNSNQLKKIKKEVL